MTTIMAAMVAGSPASAEGDLSSRDAYAKALAVKREVDDIQFRIFETKRTDSAADVTEYQVRLDAARQALRLADEELLAARRREGLPVEGVVGILPDSLPPVRFQK